MLVRVSRCAAARLHTQALPVSALTMKHPSVSSVVHGGGNRRSKPVAEKRCGLDDLRADPGHGRVGLMPARRGRRVSYANSTEDILRAVDRIDYFMASCKAA